MPLLPPRTPTRSCRCRGAARGTWSCRRACARAARTRCSTAWLTRAGVRAHTCRRWQEGGHTHARRVSDRSSLATGGVVLCFGAARELAPLSRPAARRGPPVRRAALRSGCGCATRLRFFLQAFCLPPVALRLWRMLSREIPAHTSRQAGGQMFSVRAGASAGWRGPSPRMTGRSMQGRHRGDRQERDTADGGAACRRGAKGCVARAGARCHQPPEGPLVRDRAGRAVPANNAPPGRHHLNAAAGVRAMAGAPGTRDAESRSCARARKGGRPRRGQPLPMSSTCPPGGGAAARWLDAQLTHPACATSAAGQATKETEPTGPEAFCSPPLPGSSGT
jgi:hypothetical protein